ncbi:hypothetical protein JTB14_037381 [Gonioctena quinquepunctata]|nr:hypothetical protein JTB14_037381 [Gonioctena quinquepunctata]
MPNLPGPEFVTPEGAIFPPNKPMEPRTHFSKSPVFYDNYLFLDFNEDGNCILGTSEIAGTFWEGTLLYFKDYAHMERSDYHGHYIYSTTSDAKFLSKNVIALAEDTGHINMLSLDEDSTIRTTNYFKLGCSGRSISIWDAYSEDRKPVEIYDKFHTEHVTCLDTLKQNTNLFISGARDRTACIWDLRSSIPASVIYANEFSSLTSVSWNQKDDNYIVVGTEAGDVYLVDKREPNDFVSTHHCFNAKINRTGFNGSTEFAVCGDTRHVLIVNCEGGNLKMTYENDSHSGHVKGLAWHQGTLYTCGFGKCLVKHIKTEM